MNPWDITVAVCEARGVKVVDVLGPRRWSELVRARREIARRLDEAGLSYPAIGRALGGRHHTSVMYYLGALKRRAQRGNA